MVQMNEQVAAMSQAQLDAALKLATISADSMEKFAALQLNAFKSAIADGIKAAKHFGSIKDPNELATLGTALAQPAWEKAQAYARGVYEVAAGTQSEVSAVVEQQVGEFNRNVVTALDTVLKNAPAGTEGAVTAVKSAIQSANAAYESVLKATKQVTAIAESNTATLVASATPARKKAA